MFCPNCGNQLADGTTFCTNCGTQLNNVAPEQPAQNYQQPAQNYQQPVQPTLMNEENPAAAKALTFGIISLCLCWLPIISIILGIFAIKLGRETLSYANQGYNKRPMGIVSLIFGIVSIVVSVIMTIFWLGLIIGLCALIANY